MSKFKGKKVAVVGFGLTGVSVARYMSKQGAKVVVTDDRQRTELSEACNACEDLKIEYELGKINPTVFDGADMIMLSPGINPHHKALDEARAKGIPILNDIELAATLIKEPIIAVTGTNGKTTVTSLIGEIIRSAGKKVFVGGNIGTPILNYLMSDERADYVVMEVSSYQLELVQKLVPAVAVFTNLEEDHLDRYGNFENYKNAKKKLLQVCDRNSYVVLNFDNPNIAAFEAENPGKLLWFTKKDPMTVGGSFAEGFWGSYLKAQTKKIIAKINGKEEEYDLSKFRLFGEHNRENLMAAISAARAIGIPPQAVQIAIESFKGVAHRLEFIRKKDGVFFFNDSKSTNALSMAKALGAFSMNPIILIAGGKDKNIEYAPLADLVSKRVKILILLGEAKEKMNRSLGDFAETYLVGTFEEAVLIAYQKSRSGDIILLSPGCASFDMFRNYEERGDYFKKLVGQL